MATSTGKITFLVTGHSERGALQGSSGRGAAVPVDATVKDDIALSATRSGGEDFRIDACPGSHYVVLDIKDGPSLILHPGNARALLKAQVPPKDRTAHGDDEVVVPSTLEWSGLRSPAGVRGVNRGELGKVVLSAIRIVKAPLKDKAAHVAVNAIIKRFDASVGNGVFRLSKEPPKKLKHDSALMEQEIQPQRDGTPTLVFIHGTFSDTNGSFGKLWREHPDYIDRLFEHYHDEVYALDHPTLGPNPIENALTLVRALAPKTRLHLITHSRGGLVAEVLARVCASGKIGTADQTFFKDDSATFGKLRELAEEVSTKAISVDRIVRVACPVRGTLLASNRLDAYLSVMKWALELAGIPVAPVLLELLTAIASTGKDPRCAAGLAAQTPDSALIQWLHSPAPPLPGDLRVISGDVKGDSLTAWLKTLVSDAFFWTDNDMVVQTRSMYGGMPRERGASFLFDQSGQVSHFRYFSNPHTALAMTNALIEPGMPGEFRTIGPLSWAGKDAGGIRGAHPSNNPAKPALIVLPGILGSNLKVGDERVWLSYRIINGLERLAYHSLPNGGPRIEPDGPIGMAYDKLIEYFRETHNVTPFGYDWRLPIEQEAVRLARAVSEALDARMQTRQPVRIIAHSMGGLVVRAMQWMAPEVWTRFTERDGARILMLGTPNGGSWVPMQVLSGDDTFGNTLAAVGTLFDAEKSREIMAHMPGFLQLQAGLLDPQHGLSSAQGWKTLADRDQEAVESASVWHALSLQKRAAAWGLPDDDVLGKATKLRKELDRQRAKLAQLASEKLVLVVGKARFTPDGFDVTEEDGFVYLNAVDAGDGRVTLDSAMLPNVPTWRTPHNHADLPKAEEAFKAYLDLLNTGSTTLLDTVDASIAADGTTRGGGAHAKTDAIKHERFRPSHSWMNAHPASSEAEIMGTFAFDESAREAERSLTIRVLNGNVRFVDGPLMLGHYGPDVLTGGEIVMDKLLCGRLSKALMLGCYPEAVGTQQIFINNCVNEHNPFSSSQPSAVIIVGLGEEGNLSSSQMIHTVRQGVIAWCQRMEEQQTHGKRELHLTATLLSSGAMFVTPGDAAQGVVRGVCEANTLLALHESPYVASLDLIEIYMDRATEAWLAVKALPQPRGTRFDIVDTVELGVGSLRRPLDSNYSSAGYDMVSVSSRHDPRGGTGIVYALDTRRARGELRPQTIQVSLLRQLIGTSTVEQANDEQIGHVLFRLLVPLGLQPVLGEKADLVLLLDDSTAGIPWELLRTPEDLQGPNPEPWAIRSHLLRKLQTKDYRPQVSDVHRDGGILIIGEPKIDDVKTYGRLPGAQAEAEKVLEVIKSNPSLIGADRVEALIRGGLNYPDGPDAHTIIKSFIEKKWRIVHIAGHGKPPDKKRARDGDGNKGDGDDVGIDASYRSVGGVVLSGGVFLSVDEIQAMDPVPELVFVNCCHLARSDTNEVLEGDALLSDRPEFAATVAKMLIKIGVRCVIACGWAVDDRAACVFAETFYRQLFEGKRFIDAVGEARKAAHAEHGNTWAAYQCYGDPNWMFRAEMHTAIPSPMPSEKLYAAVASARALVLALEHLSRASRYDDSDLPLRIERIQYLERKFVPHYGEQGKVAEAFAQAWENVDEGDKAVRWYERAVRAPDGGASMETAAKWARLLARLALKRFMRELPPEGPPDPATAKERIGEITYAADLLGRIAEFRATARMESLAGSAWRRLAKIDRCMANGSAQIRPNSIDAAVDHFRKAVDLARAEHSPTFFMPALKYLSASTVQQIWKEPNAADVEQLTLTRDALIKELYVSLTQRMQHQCDFWSQAALNGIKICEAVNKRRLAVQSHEITAFYEKLHATANANKFWKQVHQQAEFVLYNYAYAPQTAEAERNAADALNEMLGSWSR